MFFLESSQQIDLSDRSSSYVDLIGNSLESYPTNTVDLSKNHRELNSILRNSTKGKKFSVAQFQLKASTLRHDKQNHPVQHHKLYGTRAL